MSSNLNLWGEGMRIQNAKYGYPVPTEILIRAGWEKLMNHGGMCRAAKRRGTVGTWYHEDQIFDRKF